MSLTRTNYVTTVDALTTGTLAVPSNSIIAIIAALTRYGTDPFTPGDYTISNTGTPLSWGSPLLVVSPAVDYAPGLVVWTAQITTGENITVTIARPGGDDPAVHSVIHPISWTGHDTGSPIGVTGSASQNTIFDGAWNPSLSGSPVTSSEVVAALYGTLNSTVDVTTGTAWTQLRTDVLDDWFRYHDQVRGGSTTASVLWDDVLAPSSTGTWYNDRISFVAFEIKAAAAGGPTISVQPANATVTEPATAGFSVTAAASGGGTLSYQWQDDRGGSFASCPDGTGATSASYTTAATSSANSGRQFRCVVTETGGSSPGSLNSNAATLTINAAAVPVITDAGDEAYFNGETGIVITGTGFKAVRGTGRVYISPTNNPFDGARVEQTDTAWSDTSITVTIVKGALSFDANHRLFVINSDGQANVTGTVVQINPRLFVRHTFKSKAGANWVNETGITVIVNHSVPTGGSPNPAQVLAGQTLDGTGTSAWLINRGALALNDPVWITMMKDGSPAKAFCGKVAVSYE